MVYLDTPGIGKDFPSQKLFEMFKETLTGSSDIIDGVHVTMPESGDTRKLGAQVLKFLVSKGFIGCAAEWKNLIFVGTNGDKADEEDRACFRNEFVPELIADAHGKTGMQVLVQKDDYSSLLAPISQLPNGAIQYKRLSD